MEFKKKRKIQIMKIGILTFSRAINFGANLQACSTYYYLKNHGYDPMFIDYTPSDGKNEFKSFPLKQVEAHRAFQQQFSYTEVCHNSEEVAQVIKRNAIHNIIIGSDAVAQHHPFVARIVFPSRRIVSIMHPAKDKLFPNPFWGEFLDFLENPVNVYLMSVSNQQSQYKSFSKEEIGNMMRYVSQFKYISVRDEWTRSMYEYISNGLISPEVTPDPVFAFNYNVPFVPSKEDTVKKFNLPDKYILLALHNAHTVSNKWVKNFESICKKNGYGCIAFPFPYGIVNANVLERRVELPLSPIDWYSLIKYADGYVGHNMHTIVSALHNSVPCFCMDQYGRHILSQFVVKRSSKIYHILNAAGFPEYRSPSNTIIDLTPSPSKIFDLLMHFDKEKCKKFAENYYKKYQSMMRKIESSFIPDKYEA